MKSFGATPKGMFSPTERVRSRGSAKNKGRGGTPYTPSKGANGELLFTSSDGRVYMATQNSKKKGSKFAGIRRVK